ncbi:uncharacterized protein LOC122261655 [Penaeus japonicus]|uniref:uncharacterized protein LOC122261655 n=1 Tax=Penaeus japonicus TaxID=27405 RepID=UPI001C71785A|nr:uncharacterized protein LOC122261655 [Penaeus japonicus]
MRPLSAFLLTVLLVGICLLQVAAGSHCTPNSWCSDRNGTCYRKGESSCNGSSFSYGCEDKHCACCVSDPTVCIEKHFCLKRNGTCIPEEEDCPGEELLDGCLGEGCKCCVEYPLNITVECEATDICEEHNGTCFEKGKATCNGTSYNKGCKGMLCACCIPDTSICIAKPFCEHEGGVCVKKSAGCEGQVLSDGCHGVDCQCCVEDDHDHEDD